MNPFDPVPYIIKRLERISEEVKELICLSKATAKQESDSKKLLRRTNYQLLSQFLKLTRKRQQFDQSLDHKVALYTHVLAEKFNLDDKNILVGAYFRDIGNVVVSDSILTKTGPLSDDEYNQVQNHVENGVALLRYTFSDDGKKLQDKDMKPILDLVNYHHERGDGSGYPHGVTKRDIPFEARCLSVADTYASLRTDRPYRKGMERDNALDTLVSMGESNKLDPTIVNVFIFEELYNANTSHKRFKEVWQTVG